MDASYMSPGPGNWLVDVPYGWESDPKEVEYYTMMSQHCPELFHEDPTLKAMRLEAEAEEEAEYDSKRPTLEQYAHKMKELFNAKKALKFSDDLSAVSVGSFETDDFMSEPDHEIMRLRGEVGYLEAYKNKATQRKKLRKLLAGAPTTIESPPHRIKTPSPKKPPKKLFAAPVESSESSDSEIQIPLPKTSTLAKAGAKKFFQPPESPTTPIKTKTPFKAETPAKKNIFVPPALDNSPLKIPSPPKLQKCANRAFFSAPTSPTTPIKSPSPAKRRPSVSKGFFAAPTLSDDDSPIKIPSPPKVKTGFRKGFFVTPKLEDSPVKTPSPKKMKDIVNMALLSKTPVKIPDSDEKVYPPMRKMTIPKDKKYFKKPVSDSDSDELVYPPMKRIVIPKTKKYFEKPVLDSDSDELVYPPMKKIVIPKNKKYFKKPVLDSDSDEPVYPPMRRITIPKDKKFFAPPTSPKSPKQKLSPFKKAAQAALLASRKTDAITMTALDSELHDRLKYLQNVSTADDIYKTSKLLPDNVNQFICSRKGTPGFLELAVELETLIINTMISKIEAGVTRISPNALLNDAKSKLGEKYKNLAGNLAALT